MEKSDSDQTRTGVYGMTVAEYIRDYKMNFIFHILFLCHSDCDSDDMRLDTLRDSILY